MDTQDAVLSLDPKTTRVPGTLRNHHWHPFRRDDVVADEEHDHFLEVDWLAAESIRFTRPSTVVARAP